MQFLSGPGRYLFRDRLRRRLVVADPGRVS
ncbi:MAG: hypothetical protein QOH31_6038 [Verrucomicrobiota bacterium]|jgi:hypothetical protein